MTILQPDFPADTHQDSNGRKLRLRWLERVMHF